MQQGSFVKLAPGRWRGFWREKDGRRRATPTVPTKAEPQRLVGIELERIRLGAAYRAPITLREPAERWLAVYDRSSIRARDDLREYLLRTTPD